MSETDLSKSLPQDICTSNQSRETGCLNKTSSRNSTPIFWTIKLSVKKCCMMQV